MQPRTIRLPDHLTRFIEESSYHVSEEVREKITEDSIRYAVGKCAVSGDVLFTGGFSTVGTSTPIGKALDAPQELDTIDLREDIFEEVSENLSKEDSESPSLDYLEDIGVVLYGAESETIANATPESWWRLTATQTREEEPETPLYRRVQDMLLWSDENEQEGMFSPQNIWDNTPGFHQGQIEDFAKENSHITATEYERLFDIVNEVSN